MNQATTIDCDIEVETLLNHLRERTFGRLHDLNITQSPNGRLNVSAIAHSRFVGQLAEWAVFERFAPQDVDLSICVQISSPPFVEVQK